MSLSHDSFTFVSTKHGTVETDESFQSPLRPYTFAGVSGELHLIDEPKGRFLFCNLLLDGYASRAALETALKTIDAKAGRLTGTLTIDGTRTEPKCTFLGYSPIQTPILDGSGANGWVSRIRLVWRQRY